MPTCGTTMKHMCSWGGGWNKCSRCQYDYCDFHAKINNGGASGGHECWCKEGCKNPLYGTHCTTPGSFFGCPDCGQRVCHYHGPPNNGGSIGGHSGCGGEKCAVVIGGLTCGGKVAACGICEYNFCQNHIKSGIKHGVNGHACDIGCVTTVHTRVNCVGKRKDIIKCKLCEKAGNDYSYCQYHAIPVSNLISIGDGSEGGGHVCQGYTSGSMLFGDNIGDLFLLATEMAITVATAGAVNPATATLAGNSVKIAVNELFELMGVKELLPLKNALMKGIDKITAIQKEAEMKKLPEAEPLDKGDAVELIENLKMVSKILEGYNKGVSKLFADSARLLEAGTREISVVLNAVQKAITIIDIASDLMGLAKALNDSLTKPVVPIKVIQAVKETHGVMSKLALACGA